MIYSRSLNMDMYGVHASGIMPTCHAIMVGGDLMHQGNGPIKENVTVRLLTLYVSCWSLRQVDLLQEKFCKMLHNQLISVSNKLLPDEGFPRSFLGLTRTNNSKKTSMYWSYLQLQPRTTARTLQKDWATATFLFQDNIRQPQSVIEIENCLSKLLVCL